MAGNVANYILNKGVKISKLDACSSEARSCQTYLSFHRTHTHTVVKQELDDIHRMR